MREHGARRAKDYNPKFNVCVALRGCWSFSSSFAFGFSELTVPLSILSLSFASKSHAQGACHCCQI